MKQAQNPFSPIVGWAIVLGAASLVFYFNSLGCWLMAHYPALEMLLIALGVAVVIAGFFTKGPSYWIVGVMIVIVSIEVPEFVNIFLDGACS